mgnify:CR=1 FL=1
MKMKRVILGFSTLAFSAMFVLSCKPTANVEPQEDTEVQSALDAAWATQVVTDIEQMCAFMGENLGDRSFYNPTPDSYDATTATGSITLTRDLSEKNLNIAFNKTKCNDGNFREGTIFMRYGPDPKYNQNANPNSVYYRDFGFVGRVTLSEYKVNGWKIETESYDGIRGGPALIYNMVEKDDYDPAVTKLKWRLVGKFIFNHPSGDASKNIIWDGDIMKTLTNSTDKTVFNATKTKKDVAITWSLGVVSYEGSVKGVTEGNVAYTATLSATKPLTRDFTCFSDKVGSIALNSGSITVRPLEYHPFTQGICSFKTGTKYVRQVYFGVEGSDDASAVAPCDNAGEVLIKGISFKVDFRKQ